MFICVHLRLTAFSKVIPSDSTPCKTARLLCSSISVDPIRSTPSSRSCSTCLPTRTSSSCRSGPPLTDAVVAELKQRGHTNVIFLPLYPQYSHTTTGSSVNEFKRACVRQKYHPRTQLVREWD